MAGKEKSGQEAESLLFAEDDYVLWSKSPRLDKKYFGPAALKCMLLFLVTVVIFAFYYQSSMEEQMVSAKPPNIHFADDLNLTGAHEEYKKFSPEEAKYAQDLFFSSILSVWTRMKPLCVGPEHVEAHNDLAMLWDDNKPFQCPLAEPLTQLNQLTGVVTVSDKAHGAACFYSFMSRSQYDENVIIYSGIYAFNDSYGLSLDQQHSTVNVSCLQSGKVIYENTHMYIPTFEYKVKSDCASGSCIFEQEILQDQQSRPVIGEKDKQAKPNVLVFFLESLSQLNFARSMPKTRAVLQSLGNVSELQYFVKPLDNSFPNTMAFLTGESIPWLKEKAFKNDYFDHRFKYLWDYFHSAGYVTGFMEDLARISVFKYGKWGFREQPVDFYPRPFWVQMYPNASAFDLNRAMSKTSEFCFNSNGKKVTLFVNQVLDFVAKQTNPFFLFAFYAQMTHSELHSYKWLDDDLSQFLLALKPHLHKTILLFAGDHGFRMSSYSPTSLGRLEERMNLVTVRIPESLDSEYPHLRKFLRANSKRLTTWFDIHLMLREFATGEFRLFPSLDSYGPLNGPTNPARQLIHPYRTCASANILPEYCVCNEFVNVAIDGPYHAWDLEPAGAALAKVANRLIDENNLPCSKQSFNSTVAFKYLIPDKSAKSYIKGSAYVKIYMEPCKCSLESFMSRDQDKSTRPWLVDARMNQLYNLSLLSMVKQFVCKST